MHASRAADPLLAAVTTRGWLASLVSWQPCLVIQQQQQQQQRAQALECFCRWKGALADVLRVSCRIWRRLSRCQGSGGCHREHQTTRCARALPVLVLHSKRRLCLSIASVQASLAVLLEPWPFAASCTAACRCCAWIQPAASHTRSGGLHSCPQLQPLARSCAAGSCMALLCTGSLQPGGQV